MGNHSRPQISCRLAVLLANLGVARRSVCTRDHPKLVDIVADFASGLQAADARLPQAGNSRTGSLFRAGIGPHAEAATIALVLRELSQSAPEKYGDHAIGVPYPNMPAQRCDLCLGRADYWSWAIEVKMLRLFGENAKLNDNMLMHILSPYRAHRSTVTDCEKLHGSDLAASRQF
jgi:hypothetical protein